MASYVIEDKTSVYGYSTKVEIERNKNERYWVALDLFYVYGPPNFKTSIERIHMNNLYTKELDAYSVGKLKLHIWNDKWDPYLFKIVEFGSIFFSKLTALTNEDPTKKPSLARVLDVFTSSPYEMEFARLLLPL